jgi:hypothetical protein
LPEVTIDQPRLASLHVDPIPHDLRASDKPVQTAMTLIGTLATHPDAKTLRDIERGL